MSTSETITSTKPILGLTGAPGAGKSTVAALFAELGCAVIDADRLAHEALQVDAVRDQLVQWWGDGVLDGEGRIDRAAVGQRVFGQPEELKRLESVVHPRVHAGRAAARSEHLADPAVVAIIEDCPLLLETGLGDEVDKVVYVDVAWDVRLQRLQASRGWDADQVKKREQHQLPLDIKEQRADYVIDNGESVDNVLRQVRNVLAQALTENG